MESLLEQTTQFLQSRLQRGDLVLVAVSGGVDSMVLLDLVNRCRKELGVRVGVLHFNHELRGRESDGDEAFVRTEAKKAKIPCRTGRGNVRSFAQKNRISIEMAARQLRHEFFAAQALRQKARAVLLAHHGQDQVELFFLRAVRGAGLQGLAGMETVSPSPCDPVVELWRPLLSVPREALEQYAKEAGLRSRQDSSNNDPDALRNRVRHELLPLLQKNYQPGVQGNVLRTMAILGEENQWMEQEVGQWRLGKKNRVPFPKLPVAFQRRVILKQLEEAGLVPRFEWIEELRRMPGQKIMVSPHQQIYLDAQGLVHAVCCNPPKPGTVPPQKHPLSGADGRFIFSGRAILWKRFLKAGGIHGLRPPKQTEYFDAQKVGEEVILRHWGPGDRFQPIGMKSDVKLQDLWVNLRVPREERSVRVVATTATGEIFWVEGLRIGERFKLDNRTTERLKWQWQSLVSELQP